VVVVLVPVEVLVVEVLDVVEVPVVVVLLPVLVVAVLVLVEVLVVERLDVVEVPVVEVFVLVLVVVVLVLVDMLVVEMLDVVEDLVVEVLVLVLVEVVEVVDVVLVELDVVAKPCETCQETAMTTTVAGMPLSSSAWLMSADKFEVGIALILATAACASDTCESEPSVAMMAHSKLTVIAELCNRLPDSSAMVTTMLLGSTPAWSAKTSAMADKPSSLVNASTAAWPATSSVRMPDASTVGSVGSAAGA